MKQLLFWILVFASVVSATAQSRMSVEDTASWQLYRDDVSELSFRYPPDLRIVTLSAAAPHSDEPVHRVMLVPAAQQSSPPVLMIDVVACGEPASDPRVPCFDAAFFQAVCNKSEVLPLGNARAFQCIVLGGGACHWSATVRRANRYVTISAPAFEEQSNLETGSTGESECMDRIVATRHKLRSVLASFRFGRDH